jgi:GNAT superfamily N-acetyltransferase
VLGAGVSKKSGLPLWKQLVADLAITSRVSFPADASLEEKVDRLFVDGYNRSHRDLIDAVRSLLYRDAAAPHLPLRENQTLAATCAVIAACALHDAALVATLNFDTLTEEFLRGQGLATALVEAPTALRERAKARVLHVHGWIGREPGTSSEKIVFSKDDFIELLRGADLWSSQLQSELRSRFPLFIGVGVQDWHIASITQALKGVVQHEPSRGAFWGVALVHQDDAKAGSYEERFWVDRGIAVMRATDFDNDLPEILYGVAAGAAVLFDT